MNKQVSLLLLTLCQADKRVHLLTYRKKEIEVQRNQFLAELQSQRQQLAQFQALYQEQSSTQVTESNRLRDEEQKIVNRRKQLSTFGGAKIAKLVEREIDLASRTLEMLEERALKSLENLDQSEKQYQEQQRKVEELELAFESENQSTDAILLEVQQELRLAEEGRQSLIISLDERIRRLYERVAARYPGEAVAIAEAGSCKSCFRALPPQTFQQVLAGNSLLQCPGCSRILVVSVEPVEG